MLGFPSFRNGVLALYTLIHAILAVPYSATPTLTGGHLNIPRQVSPRITLHQLNMTYHMVDSEIKYHIPNTQTTLYLSLGFPCKEEGIRSTIISGRSYCEQHLEQKGDGPLSKSEDPFHEDLGYGAAITIVPARPDHRLTWSILKDSMDGLWGFLIEKGYYMESEFYIYHDAWGLMGRGTIIEVPEIEFPPQTQKRQASDSLGSKFG